MASNPASLDRTAMAVWTNSHVMFQVLQDDKGLEHFSHAGILMIFRQHSLWFVRAKNLIILHVVLQKAIK